ncbi:MAG: PilZ domain-containing protein [Blastocatellia bacterium]|nr:PilZ domain-containing protein [Blastocatellia bacterium]MBL8194397.1 PilZ domain-containing protein [Blastocatellia bacterium]MBN8725620.1 PilZ domain-containing protein [Acidobacteriota bacterium]
MLATTNLIEHRREIREETNTLIKFKEANNKKAEEQFAVILDITEHGAALFTYSLVPLKSKIIIDRGNKILLKAEVVSATLDKESDMFRLGVRFIK